ncbi:MAG TPA: EAL domain-containing protein [Kofleriaceae bacterium]|nr:EAL domain-containing protein [Kofleriaceae bacterium]
MTVQEALEAGKLYIAYQPLVDLRRRTTFGFESLVRSEAPEFPNALSVIEAAVEARFMGQLGRALRRMAVEGMSQASALFVNLHPDEFDEGWLVRPDDATAWHEGEIFLEITESVPLTHYRYCHSVLREMRAKGLKIAVDDLGAGYSNIKYIADLAPEVVKLDRTLVANLRTGTRLHTLVTAMVELCQRLGARVVAEGIETRAELEACIETGAHYGQGYYLGRPSREPVPVDWSRLE